MGFLDDAKDKIHDLLDGHEDKADDAIDKAADVVDDKTGGEHTEQIDAVAEKAKDALGVDDAAAPAAPPTPAAPVAPAPPADQATPPA
jgi:hypothetical protein